MAEGFDAPKANKFGAPWTIMNIQIDTPLL
jgi:hypothetical protein